jgi:hypothetical protein
MMARGHLVLILLLSSDLHKQAVDIRYLNMARALRAAGLSSENAEISQAADQLYDDRMSKKLRLFNERSTMSKARGLHENDFIMVAKFDKLAT